MVYLVVWLAIAILAIDVAIQNVIPTTVVFLFWKFESTLAMVIIIAFAVGMAVGLFSELPAIIKNKIMIARQRRKIQEMEKKNPDKQETLEKKEGG